MGHGHVCPSELMCSTVTVSDTVVQTHSATTMMVHVVPSLSEEE